ncbi:DUF2752 domain-containing protein [Flavobacterium hibisci]|uniref:DUF2752 domain-containing protein n=1 Tax=Flavobacterium hibisci TaxID=1914462 RepID=UPI001CBF088E|nr:DUF2752 domain-containing protein [Flavobacterium hibisci]MBZ4042895.1 DUF2752 domain-containing protein [Flavobacterium hibisci]
MDLEKYMLPCFSKTLFGIECLGCGFQRALFLLFRGNFLAAFNMYPAIYTTLIFLTFVALRFLNKAKNYNKLLWISGIINGMFMIAGYYYKHFYL